MKTKFSLLILFTSLCFGCTATRRADTKIAQFAGTAATAATPLPASDSNSATVISLHANLRAADNSQAAVLEVVPQDASVEVVKQQGVWFLVKTETNQGWMHGNTLKLQNYSTRVAPSPASTRNSTITVKPRVSEPEIENSGASAKCRDGSLSYSAHRRGTCSHHGGVAIWY